MPLDVYGIVLSCVCVFWCISSISRSENHPFLYYCSNLIGKPLACSLKTSTFLQDLPHSFLITSLWMVASKIALLCKMIVFPGPCFAFWSLIVLVSNIVIHVPEKRATDIRRMTVDLPCWLSEEHLPIMTPMPVIIFWYWDWTFLSWVVYCGYTRPSGCFWSAHLI